MTSQIQNTTPDPVSHNNTRPEQNSRSFLDKFMDTVERLPVPYWLTYMVLIILQGSIFHVLAWIDGWLSAYTLNPILFLFPLWLWGPLAIMTYLDSISIDALSSFSPLLDIHQETMRRLKIEFTNLPTRGLIINGIIWSVFYFIFTFLAFDLFYTENGIGTSLTVFSIFVGLFTFFIGSALFYHSLRHLRLINRTVKMVKQFNLFRLDPVYAFSRVTARTGVAWVIMLSVTFLIFPLQLASVPVLAMLVMQVVLAIVIFVWPLWIVNQHLVSEKRRLIGELNQRVELTLERMHSCLDGNSLNEMGELNDAIAGLNAERETLTKIPTWPWRAGTFTGFLSAIMIPIILFLIQLVIGNLLGE